MTSTRVNMPDRAGRPASTRLFIQARAVRTASETSKRHSATAKQYCSSSSFVAHQVVRASRDDFLGRKIARHFPSLPRQGPAPFAPIGVEGVVAFFGAADRHHSVDGSWQIFCAAFSSDRLQSIPIYLDSAAGATCKSKMKSGQS